MKSNKVYEVQAVGRSDHISPSGWTGYMEMTKMSKKAWHIATQSSQLSFVGINIGKGPDAGKRSKRLGNFSKSNLPCTFFQTSSTVRHSQNTLTTTLLSSSDLSFVSLRVFTAYETLHDILTLLTDLVHSQPHTETLAYQQQDQNHG